MRIRPQITYKPGWSFSWERHDGREMLFIKVVGPTSQGVDAYTGEPREVTYAFEQDPFDADALFNRIHGIEYHEACEWFRVDGELLFDPHATEGRLADDAEA